jgi:hypothetical protein
LSDILIVKIFIFKLYKWNIQNTNNELIQVVRDLVSLCMLLSNWKLVTGEKIDERIGKVRKMILYWMNSKECYYKYIYYTILLANSMYFVLSTLILKHVKLAKGLTHVVRSSISGSYVWRKFGWKRRTHIIRRGVCSENFIPISL